MAHVLLIDALNLIRRLYAVQERPYLPLTEQVADSTRAQIIDNTEAMLRQALQRLLTEFSPSHALMVFDGQASHWRKQLYAGYKANRKPMPEILAQALPTLQQAVSAIGIHNVYEAECEADDIIASVATRLTQRSLQAEQSMRVSIVSTDKGFLPLMSEYISIYDPFSRQYQTAEAVIEKFGVAPLQLVRYWSLVGDSTNNIPGVAGIGPKGAQDLMALGDTLSDALAHPDCPKKLREKILSDKDNIKIFMQVLSLRTDIQLGLNLQDMRINANGAAIC